MKKYRFVGTQEEADDYLSSNNPIVNKIYSENDFIGQLSIKEWLNRSFGIRKEWEEVTDEDVEKQEILDTVNKPLKDNIKMTNDLADQLVEERIEAIKHSLSVKAKEYVRNDDRMHNFNIASQKSGQTREKCLAGFRLKHEISAEDIRNDIELGKLPSEEVVREKYGDIINYYILEEMSIIHKIRNAN